MFVGGCGRFFEGSANQMHHNLTQVLGTLPPETVSGLKEKTHGVKSCHCDLTKTINKN